MIMHLGKMIEEVGLRWGDKTAVKLGEKSLSYAELDSYSNKLASSLKALGIKHGDRVAILLNNSPEFVLAYFAIVKLGAIAVPLDIKYRLKELICIFGDCRPRAIIAEETYTEMLNRERSKYPYLEIIIVKDKITKEKHYGLWKLVAEGANRKVENGTRDEDIAHIAYTSGPILKPTGVMLVHSKLIKGTTIAADSFKQTDKDVVLQFALPMHHMVGLVVVMLTAISRGSTIVMLQGFSTTAVIQKIKEEGITILLGVPFIFAMLVRDANKGRIGTSLFSVRLCASVGAPLSMETFYDFKKTFGQYLLQFYGLTETTVHVTCQPDKDGVIKPGSVGVILAHFEIKIVSESGNTLGPGEVGEIIIKGPTMKGYYKDSGFYAVKMRDGWIYTGDFGYLDEDASLFITGINKPMFISKGQNIYFSDIEEIITEMDGVKETAVIAIPDPDNMRGQVARAFVCLAEDTEVTEMDIKQFVLKQLASYKVPKQIVFISKLPRRDDLAVDRALLSKYTTTTN